MQQQNVFLVIIISLIKMASTAIRSLIGRAAPQFKATAWNCRADKFEDVSLESFKSKWVLLFFYPLDFTFVCPTEIIDFSKRAQQFRDANCQVVGCSIDSHFCHKEWTNKPRDQGGLGKIDIPLIADVNKQISSKYGVLNDGGISYRGTFIIDDNQVVKHLSINELGVGRNVDQYLRLVKAFQHNAKHGQVCPASWTPGARTMSPGSKDKLDAYWKEVHAKK